VVSVYCVFGVSGDVSTLSSGRLLADGNFHHVAFTWDGVYGKLWIDGALDTVFAAVGVPIPAADLSNLYLGLGGDEVHLDEFRISNIVRYTTSFTPSKCNQLDANTIALWHCDEGSGLSIADATGNHNATFDPASDWVVGVF
jgi:hypothetical protein